MLRTRWQEDAAATETTGPTIASAEDFGRAIAAARPGDVIVIADRRYSDWQLQVPASVSGTAGRAIRIRAARPGGAIFTGTSQIVIRGNYIEVAGLRFEGTGAPTVAIFGNHGRLTEISFIDAGTRDRPHQPILRVEFGASDNEIDHCRFVGSASVSIQVKVPTDEQTPLPMRNHIHDNEFRDIQRFSKNGQEPIQLGQTEAGGHHALMTLVERNRFLRADGDDELVSIKSSRNVIRYNVAIDSDGGLSLREGNGNLVEGNVLRRTKRGIVVTGDRQTVINNFVDAPRLEGILIAVGSKRFAAATNSIIAHNTIINAGTPLSFALRDPVAVAMPTNNKIVNNVFGGVDGALIAVVHGQTPFDIGPSANVVERNLFYAPGATGRALPEIADVERADLENMIADPHIDLGEPDLPRLARDSPARGRAIPGFADRDIAGRPRGTSAGAVDIGAYQSPLP
jgi:poly(beta-D-mannuronate) lyase